MTNRTPKRPATTRKTAPAFDPIPMFDLDAYCAEYPPSVKRIRTMQEAAQAEAHDAGLPPDARRHNLRRTIRWIETLLDQLDEGDDHDLRQPDDAVPRHHRAA
jgi:hypothetical protein